MRVCFSLAVLAALALASFTLYASEAGKFRDGVYDGSFCCETAGSIRIRVSGETVACEMVDEDGGIRGAGTGRVNPDGRLDCALSGRVDYFGGFPFTASLTGKLDGTRASGEWSARAFGTETGFWGARRR